MVHGFAVDPSASAAMASQTESPLAIGKHITCLPVVHGSGHCAMVVRQWLLEHAYDCVVVCLPESFKSAVLESINHLPTPSIVLQRAMPDFSTSWDPDRTEREEERDEQAWSYVPIDPCQPVIMALRHALGEHVPIEFIDLETNVYEPQADYLPDPYALKTVPIERFAAAILPSLGAPDGAQVTKRLSYMGYRLHQLERRYKNILVVCSIPEWPWLRENYRQWQGVIRQRENLPEHDSVEPPTAYSVSPNSLCISLW